MPLPVSFLINDRELGGSDSHCKRKRFKRRSPKECRAVWNDFTGFSTSVQRPSSAYSDSSRHATRLVNSVRLRRITGLELSVHKQVERKCPAGVSSLDFDRQSEKFLLAGGSNGAVLIYDVSPVSHAPDIEIKTVAYVKRTSKRAHQHAVSDCQWYAHDTGLFLTCSTDQRLLVWDSNTLKHVECFQFPDAISQIHWSTVPSKTPLIAAATGISNVHLIDVRCGSSMQQLRGHKSVVNCVRWSPVDANVLVSGCYDGRTLVWDIRSAKSYLKSLCVRASKSSAQMQRRNGHLLSYDKRSHFGAVNGLKFSEDGLFMFSSGTDGYLRVWNAVSLDEQPNTRCQYTAPDSSRLPVQFCVVAGASTSVVFMPDGDDIEMLTPFDKRAHDDGHRRTLRGHYNRVTTAVCRSAQQELYSCARDRAVLVWVPAMDQDDEQRTAATGRTHVQALHEDEWSD